jgi:curved DNA-binding protein CbpA
MAGIATKDADGVYACLGLATTATRDEIAAAYKRLRREVVPKSQAGDDAATRQWTSISDAYTLLTSDARELYDTFGLAGVRAVADDRENPYSYMTPTPASVAWNDARREAADEKHLSDNPCPPEGDVCAVCIRDRARRKELDESRAARENNVPPETETDSVAPTCRQM